MQKRTGFRQKLYVDPAGGTAFVHVANIVDGWSGPSTTRDVAVTTVLEDTYHTKLGEQVDPGTANFDIAYDPLDTNSQILADLYASGDTATWKQEYYIDGSDTVSETFSAFISEFGRETRKGDLMRATISLTISGNPGFSGSGKVVDA